MNKYNGVFTSSELADKRREHSGLRGKKLSFERWLENEEREILMFRAPAEGELLQYGFTQLPTAAAKLRPLGG